MDLKLAEHDRAIEKAFLQQKKQVEAINALKETHNKEMRESLGGLISACAGTDTTPAMLLGLLHEPNQ